MALTLPSRLNSTLYVVPSAVRCVPSSKPGARAATSSRLCPSATPWRGPNAPGVSGSARPEGGAGATAGASVDAGAPGALGAGMGTSEAYHSGVGYHGRAPPRGPQPPSAETIAAARAIRLIAAIVVPLPPPVNVDPGITV